MKLVLFSGSHSRHLFVNKEVVKYFDEALLIVMEREEVLPLPSSDLSTNDKELLWVEAIINSMTNYERSNPHILDGNRRMRIAKGSGRSVQEVNSLLKKFNIMKKMMKKFSSNKKSILPIFGRIKNFN